MLTSVVHPAQLKARIAAEFDARSTSEADMPAYWVARSRINDPVEYKEYTDCVPAIIAKFGGKVLARGGRFKIMPNRSRAVALAISQPEEVDVNEILFRPTRQQG